MLTGAFCPSGGVGSTPEPLQRSIAHVASRTSRQCPRSPAGQGGGGGIATKTNGGRGLEANQRRRVLAGVSAMTVHSSRSTGPRNERHTGGIAQVCVTMRRLPLPPDTLPNSHPLKRLPAIEFYSMPRVSFEVIDTPGKGRGLVARRPLRAGQLIVRIAGRVIDDPLYSSRYCIDMGGGRSLEPDPPGGAVESLLRPELRIDRRRR